MKRLWFLLIPLAATGVVVGQDDEPPVPMTGPPVRYDFTGLLVPEADAVPDIVTGDPVRFDFTGLLVPEGETVGIVTGSPVRFDFTGLLVPEGEHVSGGPQTASAPPPPPPGPSESGDTSAPASSGPTGGPSQPQQPPPPPPPGPSGPTGPAGSSAGGQPQPPPPSQTPSTPSFRSPPMGTSLRSTVSASLREVHYEGTCVKMGRLFKVTGTGFGAPGSYELRLRTAGVRHPLPLQVRRWTDREIVGAVAPHPELKPDGRTQYELVLTDRRGSVQTQLRKPITVCR